MALVYTLPKPPTSPVPKDASGTSKEKLIVYFQELFFPEFIFVEDVCRENLRSDAAR